MSTFRYKAAKQKKQTTLKEGTLDIKHRDTMKRLDKEKKNLPTLKKDLDKYKSQLINLDKKDPTTLTTNDAASKSQLKNSIDDIESKVNTIENNYNEIDYLFDTSDILCDYYDIINDKNKKPTSHKSIMDFFKKPSPSVRAPQPTEEKVHKNRAELYDQYMSITEPGSVKKKHTNKLVQHCLVCNIEKTLIISDGIMVCTKCGDTDFIIIESDKPNFKEPIPDTSAYAYKRINHFNEWLSQFQAKESTEIPNETFGEILLEINKSRIHNLALLTPEKMRQILKKLRYNKYYEHIPHIINKLNGVPPPNMTREVEERMRVMFRQIQEPFTLHCPKDRKNFLSYSYVLHKFCQLMELDAFLQCFPLLKSREKLQQQDRIWKLICKTLGWEFIASI